MTGSIRKLSKGKWELCISLGFDIKGKRIRKFKTIYVNTKKEAELELVDFVKEHTTKQYTAGGNLELNEFFQLWMKDYAEKGLRKKTYSRYKTLWPRVNECLGHFKIKDIRPTHLIQFYNMLRENGVRLDGKYGGLSPSTIKHHHTLISTVLESAMLWELINSNPCRKIKLAKLGITNKESKKKTNEMIYTLDEIKYMLKQLEQENFKFKTIVYLAIFTGCRREEILGLEWGDINFNTGEILIQRSIQYTVHHGTFEDELKNYKSERSCFVPKRVLNIIEEYKKSWYEIKATALKNDNWNETNKLFIQKNGLNMHPDTPSSWFIKFLKKNYLRHTRFHNLRHFHASILLDMGMNMKSIADQMGHSDLQMLVTRYTHSMTKNSYETAKFMDKALFDED